MDKYSVNSYGSRVYVPKSSNWEHERAQAKKASILNEEKRDTLVKLAASSVYSSAQDPYPSPFLNLSDMQLPRTMVEVLKWCRYFYKFDPLIAGAINALATFPVTKIVLEDIEVPNNTSENSPLFLLYEKLFFERANMSKLLVEIGIDYWLYGNCFVFGEFANFSQDPNLADIQWKAFTRLDPCRMVIDVDPLTQEKTYKWEVPPSIRRICKDRKPTSKYNAVPDVIKSAVRLNKAVVLNENNVYHFSRPSESGDGSVWGTPTVLNVLKLLMYRNVLRQAQEAIAREHIVPFRIYYLNPTESYNPIEGWADVARAFGEQLKQSQKDPNYKVVSPIPVDVLNLGGQGRALLLTPEIEQIQGEILAGMGVPREFIFGGISYSGSSIALRILENQFVTYRLSLEDFMNNFVIKKMAELRGDWRSEEDDKFLINAKLSDLKMQDDVQQKQLIINLNAAGKLPDDEVYKMLGLDTAKVEKKLQEELIKKMQKERMMQLYAFETQMVMQQQQMAMQMQSQGQVERPQKSNENGRPEAKDNEQTEKAAALDFDSIEKLSEAEAFNIARNLSGMNQTQRNIALGKLPLAMQSSVNNQLGKLNDLKATESSTTDMRPLPEIKPPRRKTGIV